MIPVTRPATAWLLPLMPFRLAEEALSATRLWAQIQCHQVFEIVSAALFEHVLDGLRETCRAGGGLARDRLDVRGNALHIADVRGADHVDAGRAECLDRREMRAEVIDEGDLEHDQIEIIAKRLGVTKQDVIDMNRWFSGDASLNAPIRADSDSGERQDWLVDEAASQETTLATRDEYDYRRKTLALALCVLNDRERRIFEARRLAEDPITLAGLAAEFGVSPERVRQIDVRSFEKVQKAVKNRLAAKDTPAPLQVR